MSDKPKYNRRPKNHIQIPVRMWNWFDMDNSLDTLTYYCHLRSLYKYPVIFNTSYSKVAKMLNISVNTLKFHLRKLESIGVVYWKGDTLYLSNIKRLRALFPSPEKYKTIGKFLTIKVCEKISETKILVKSVPFVTRIKQIDFYLEREVSFKILQCRASKTDLGGKAKKQIDNFEEKKRKAIQGYNCISNKRIATILGRKSDKTAIRYKKKLKELKVIDYRRRFKIVEAENDSLTEYFNENPKAFKATFLFHGILVQELPCQYKIFKNKFVQFHDWFEQTYTLQSLRNMSGYNNRN